MDFEKLSRDIAAALAERMPDHAFSVDSDGSGYAFINIDSDGAGLTLYHRTREKRIEIGGRKARSSDGWEYPITRNDPWVDPITVADHRAPAAIAGEIHRKMFPAYLQVYADAAKLRDKHEEYRKKEQSNKHEIAAILGTPNPDEYQDRIRSGGPDGIDKGYIREIDVFDDRVNLHINGIPVDIAKEMLKLWISRTA